MVPEADRPRAHGLRTDKCNDDREGDDPGPLPLATIPPRSARPDTTPEPFGARRSGGARPQSLRGAEACGPPPPLRLPAGAGRRAPVLGGPEGPVARPGRQAARGPGRGPPGRVRRLRGRDPGRQLRRGRGHRLGPRALDDRRRPEEALQEGQAPLRPGAATSCAAAGRSCGSKTRGKTTGKEWLLIKERDGYVGATAAEPLPDGSRCCPASTRRGAARPGEAAPTSSRRAARLERAAAAGRRRRRRARCSPSRATAPSGGRAGSSSSSTTASACSPSARAPRCGSSTAAARDAAGTFPELARALRALPVRPLRRSTARSSCSTRRRGRASAGSSSARCSTRAPRRRARRGRAARDALPLRPARASRTSTCARCRSRERKALLRRLVPGAGPDPLRRPRRRTAATTSSRARASSASRASSPRSSTRRTGADATATGSRCASTARDDFVVVGYTKPEGARHRLRRAAPRVRDAGEAASSTPAASAAASPRSSSTRSRRCSRATELREAAVLGARCPTGRGHALGRAAARLRGPLQGDDRRGPAPPAGLPAPARRQARRRSACASDAPARATPRRPCAAPPAAAAARAPSPTSRPFSNLEKVFWPEDGYTKGDLIDYYRAISPWLLPYLQDRPLVLTRYPDGIAGQVVLPEGRAVVRAGLGAHRADLERARGARDRLLRLRRRRVAALRRQPRHDPAPRLVEPRRDARSARTGASSTSTRRARRSPTSSRSRSAIHALCDEIGLPSFVKTSGADRAARADPARSPVHVRRVPDARRAPGAGRRRGAAARSRRSRA